MKCFSLQARVVSLNKLKRSFWVSEKEFCIEKVEREFSKTPGGINQFSQDLSSSHAAEAAEQMRKMNEETCWRDIHLSYWETHFCSTCVHFFFSPNEFPFHFKTWQRRFVFRMKERRIVRENISTTERKKRNESFRSNFLSSNLYRP